MTKIILISLYCLSLTACSLGFSRPEPISWQSIKGDFKPINPDMLTYQDMHPIETHNNNSKRL